MALQFNQTGGDNSKGEKQTLISPLNTINVTETETGHEIDVDTTIIETINNKQDKVIVGGFQTNALYSMSYVERQNVNPSNPNILPRRLGYYVPLLEVQSINLGKSQFEFSIFSREDALTYYGRYLFCTHDGNVKFELLDYCQDQRFINPPSFTPTNIIAFEIKNNGAGDEYKRYLICKKIVSTASQLDAYFVNILSQDIGFCYSKKFYSRNPQTYFTPQEFIHISTDYKQWKWYWNSACKTLEKEYEIQGVAEWEHTVNLEECQQWTPTPAIIKPLTINGEAFTGVTPKSISTEDWYADGVVGENADGYHDLYCTCQVVAGSHLDSSYQNHVYLNFSTPDVNKKYVVYGFITNKGNGYYIPAYVIEING